MVQFFYAGYIAHITLDDGVQVLPGPSASPLSRCAGNRFGIAATQHPLNQQLAEQFGSASIFGIAPLHSTFVSAMNAQPQQVAVMVIAMVMVVLMTASQFITQLQIVSKNMSEETKASPAFRQQRILLYLLPLVFAFSGFTFPLGVMFYWLVSNFWTMGQQFIVIRNMPTPGSQAAKDREERLARRGKLPKGTTEVIEVEAPKPAQRAQPVGKNRAKKSGKKK